MKSKDKLVVLESPFKEGDTKENIKYAVECMKDCFLRGEYPFASHLLYTVGEITREHILRERELGIKAGFAWGRFAKKTVIYTERGITSGMKKGIEEAKKQGREIEYRKLK